MVVEQIHRQVTELDRAHFINTIECIDGETDRWQTEEHTNGINSGLISEGVFLTLSNVYSMRYYADVALDSRVLEFQSR